ncbi:GTP-binding protein [Cellulosimicrobium protaetiae]|uniref:Cobalamin biosynthesis protein CobW n=1 Tax=Cellulosimicrobium protaetiae TaxID=2587808 RepID=A0A6M5U8V7_9MICO|nr:GTP-binding protein [Cellulosimicrobium protaetiae]QJW34947.1 cobalamin biosynthesis protein CobW [Cellulosimicrobium protaetiae]
MPFSSPLSPDPSQDPSADPTPGDDHDLAAEGTRPAGTGDARVALSVLATIDPVLRDSAVFGLVVGTPRVVALRHDIHAADGALRRVVVDATGVIEDETVPLEHACLSCAVREDAVPTLRRLAEDDRWDHVVLALPVAAESLPVVRALAAQSTPGNELQRLRLATAVCVVDLDTLEHDLLDDDGVDGRGVGLTEDDQRAVGEVLAAQLEHADLVVTTGEPSDAPTGSTLVDRVRGTDSLRLDGLHALTAGHLARRTHDPVAGERRAHPLGVRGPLRHRLRVPGDRSWTIELRSSRPFDPERLLRRIEDLGTGRVRARGVFHVANRPDSLCAWDGAGGQLCIGTLGTWQDATDDIGLPVEPRTRIVVVGATDTDGDDDERGRILAAFRDVLATPDELADGGLRWLGRTDVLAPWLGARSDAV